MSVCVIARCVVTLHCYIFAKRSHLKSHTSKNNSNLVGEIASSILICVYVCLCVARFSNDFVLQISHLVVYRHCPLYSTMKTRSEKCASAQKKKHKSRKIDPNLVILACIDLIQEENATLMTVSEKHLKIIAKRFNVKSESVQNVLKGFQPIVKVKKM